MPEEVKKLKQSVEKYLIAIGRAKKTGEEIKKEETGEKITRK